MRIKRIIFDRLKNDLSERYTTILVGARQVGKTFLLRELERYARTQRKQTAFFDLEQPHDLAQFNRSDAEIIDMLVASGDVVFIDEFHYLKNASRIFKAIYDRDAPLKIYASGSSALEIHAHLQESLVGRKFLYPIFPCNLEEMSQAISSGTLDLYFVFGGMPGTLQFDDDERKKQLLNEIMQAYLLKDVKALIREENLRAFNHLLYLLASAQGNVTSVESLSKEVGLTAHTVQSYLDILEQTYVNFAVSSYSTNLANELKKSKKYYFYDLGIRNALLKNFSHLKERQDAGAIVESFVFGELRQQISPETELRFWRLKGGEEVDFIWIKNQIAYPLEVKLSWSSQEIPSGLKAFLRRYPKTKKAFVVSAQGGGKAAFQNTPVFFRSFEEVARIPREL